MRGASAGERQEYAITAWRPMKYLTLALWSWWAAALCRLFATGSLERRSQHLLPMVWTSGLWPATKARLFCTPWHRSLGKGLLQANRAGGWRHGLRPATWHGRESCFPQLLRDLLCTCAWEDAQWEAGLHQGVCGWHLCNWISGHMDADVLS